MPRKLRIAVSAFFGLLTLLLILLWVRSYWWWDEIQFPPTSGGRCIRFGSVKGSIGISVRHYDGHPMKYGYIVAGSIPASRMQAAGDFWFYEWGNFIQPNWSLSLRPCWIAVFTVGMAGVPWIHWRFSLRTLLISTTLLAIVLGLVMWAGQ